MIVFILFACIPVFFLLISVYVLYHTHIISVKVLIYCNDMYFCAKLRKKKIHLISVPSSLYLTLCNMVPSESRIIEIIPVGPFNGMIERLEILG